MLRRCRLPVAASVRNAKDASLNVLVVEDEALVAMIAEEALSSLGFEPRSARNAGEALAQVETLAPSLAVIDVGLPDLRGDELAERLRAMAPDLPIVVASGYDEAELKARFSHDPKIQVVAKPYTEDDLARATRALGFGRA
jgi:CheY-like chemotaxis protein